MSRWKVFPETRGKLPKLLLEEMTDLLMNADLQRYSYYVFIFQKMNNIK